MLLNSELVCVDDDLARLLLLVAELCGVPGGFRSGFAASRQRHSPAPQSLEIRLRQVALLVPPHHTSIRTWRRRRSRSHPNMHFSISLSLDGFTHSQRINTEFSNSLGKPERPMLQIWKEKGIQSARYNSPE